METSFKIGDMVVDKITKAIGVIVNYGASGTKENYNIYLVNAIIIPQYKEEDPEWRIRDFKGVVRENRMELYYDKLSNEAVETVRLLYQGSRFMALSGGTIYEL